MVHSIARPAHAAILLCRGALGKEFAENREIWPISHLNWRNLGEIAAYGPDFAAFDREDFSFPAQAQGGTSPFAKQIDGNVPKAARSRPRACAKASIACILAGKPRVGRPAHDAKIEPPPALRPSNSWGVAMTLLSLRNLRVTFAGAESSAVDGLSLQIARGETLALVGESGCGKSTTALSIMQLLPRGAALSGEVRFQGQDLLGLKPKALREVRGNRIGMIFQEPMTSLNPMQTIGAQIIEVLRAHRKITPAEARARAIELLDLVRIPSPEARVDDYPHQFSGGQRQRVMIAMAIACEPELLIADEPTTALDATIQAQILELIHELRVKLGMAVLLISHDLSLVAKWADRVVVMHHGQVMEELPAAQLFKAGAHPYTRGLIGASIRVEEARHYRSGRLAEIRVRHGFDGSYQFDLHRPKARPIAPVTDPAPVLEARDLLVRHGAGAASVTALNGVSIALRRGETLGLVGESGSGKSTLSKALMRLLSVQGGQILHQGQDITGLEGRALAPFRRSVQMVFQDPFASLNPRQSIATILEGPLKLHEGLAPPERRRRTLEMLDLVRLPASAAERYPHEFSGGQRQRVAIARALILRPSVVLCDEPVSALDVSVQAQILNLLADLKAELGLSLLFITHDLAVVRYISDRIAVMKSGQIVEVSDPERIWQSPAHPYTRELMAVR